MFPLPVSTSSLLGKFNSRRLLLDTPPPIPSTRAHSNTLDSTAGNRFDPNIVMILAVLLCALVCALGLNLVVRCALRCSSRVGRAQAATRLANTGVKKKALKTFPTLAYSPGLNLPRLDSECAICLTEFAQGECVRVLPRCNHGFHAKCIDKWLTSHSSCPTCRQCLLNTCQKIVECSRGESLGPQQIIVPLDPEGLLINYRTVY